MVSLKEIKVTCKVEPIKKNVLYLLYFINFTNDI